MRVKIPPVLLLLLAVAIGYLLGTERGRAQRDVILVKLGRKADEDEPTAAETIGTEETEPVDDETETVTEETEPVDDETETVTEETETAVGEATEPAG